MAVEVHLPGWRADERARGTAPNVRGEQPVHVALVANGKPNSVELLQCLAPRVAEELPVADVRGWRKDSVSVPPTPAQFDEIVGWADVALVAVGD